MPAFVKFSRGLISTYNHLTKKDPDTLYLVYESKDAVDGLLYLGDKLISQVGSGNPQISLNDLTNVDIDNNLEDGMLLQYNNSTGNGRWQAVALSDIPFSTNNISITESLNNLSNNKEKDIAVVRQDVFIYYDNKWNRLTDSTLIERVATLETKVGQKASEGTSSTGLYKEIDDLKANVYTKQEIDNLQHLQYQVVNSLQEIDINNSSSNIIYLVPKDSDDSDDGYEEYSVIDGQLERIGSHNIDLSNYVTTDDSRLLTETQKDKIDSLGIDDNNQATIQSSQVINLTQAIQDNQIIKSVSPASFNLTAEGELQLKATPSIDLSDYIKTSVFNATVGDLSTLVARTSPNSTLVQEINSIKQSVVWQELSNN